MQISPGLICILDFLGDGQDQTFNQSVQSGTLLVECSRKLFIKKFISQTLNRAVSIAGTKTEIPKHQHSKLEAVILITSHQCLLPQRHQ